MSHGPTFAIIGERYRLEGKVNFSLDVQMEPPDKGSSGSFSPAPVEPFVWSSHDGCSGSPPVKWNIVFGLLRDPSTRAYAYTGSRPRPLLTARIPASLHLGGVIGYIALPEFPSAIVVRSGTGTAIQNQSFGTPPDEPCEPGSSGGTIVFQAPRARNTERRRSSNRRRASYPIVSASSTMIPAGPRM